MSDELSVLRAVLQQMPESVAVYDPDGRVRYANPLAERLIGCALAEMSGQILWEVMPHAVGTVFHAAFERVAAGGPDEQFDRYYLPVDRWFTTSIRRVGALIHVVARDVTDDVRRRRRLEALARVSDVLTADELDPAGAPQAIAEVLMDALDADCSLAVVSADSAWLDLVAVASRDPIALQLARSVTRVPSDRGHPADALRSRTAVLAQTAALDTAAAEQIVDPKIRDVVERYRPTTLIVAPLIVGDDVIGVLMANRRRGAPLLTEDDRTLVSEIAPGVGLYLAHARRRAEATSLRHRLTAITDSNPALVSFVDRDRRYLYVNASYERLFRRPREEILGLAIEDLVGAEAWKALAPHVDEALSGTPVRFRSPVTYPWGETRHIDAQYLPIVGPTGDVDGIAVLVVDVTAEVQLAAAEQRRHDEERHATRRLESLLAVTAQLAAADSAEEIARVVVDQGVDAIEAALSGLWLLSPDKQELVLLRERGFQPAHAAAFARVPLSGGGHISECMKTCRPLWVESRADYAARFPHLEPVYRPDPAPPLAFALLPLVILGTAVGCVNFTFHDERRLTPDERTYLEVLASHTAEALRRARLYAELRDASETREAMIQASPAAILLLDDDGVVQAWNPAAERILGWTADEVLGQVLPAIGAKRKLSTASHLLDGQVTGGRETKRLRKSGEWFDAELYTAPVRLSDGRTRCLLMVVDISDRKRIERGVRLIAEATAVLARSLDGEQTLGRLVRLPKREYADGCAVDLLDDGDLHRVAVTDDVSVPRPRQLALPEVLSDPNDEELVRTGARSVLTVPLRVGHRLLGGLSFASRTRMFDDVDVAIARELATHAATAIENARLYREARAARLDAEAANLAKDQFLAILGHELRNPLAPISIALHLMKQRAPEQLARERGVIERQVDHLMRLVDDLLDVSRITGGKVEIRRERTSISAVVASGIELASPLLEQRAHRLTVDVPSDLVVNGDPIRLSQIVANLVSNAAKYTPTGGNIDVRGVRRGDVVVLSVQDDGSGIAPEMLRSIFEAFVQAPQESARTDGGLGLGLAIVRSLVELHGGTVAAHSDGIGRGTELVVTLPAAPDGEPEVARQPAARPAPTTPRRVLVVDDNEDAAELLGEVLDAHGHVTRTACDGPSALRIAEEFCPDVAVLDIGLPVMDGYELANRLRAAELLPTIRLIAVTGYGQEADRARSRAAGFEEHLTKPVPIEKLVRLVADPG